MTNLIADSQAEKAIIGIAMNYPDALEIVSALDPRLFVADNAKAAHKAICGLCRDGLKSIDLIVLDAEVKKQGVECTAFLMECLSMGLTSGLLGRYTATLTECLKRRELAEMAENVLRCVNDPSASVDALCEQAVNAGKTTVVDANDTVSAKDALIELLEHKSKMCPTGLPKFDRITGGFECGGLIILAARPAVGKSALAMQIALNVALNGGGVLFVTLEMSSVEVITRIVASVSGVDAQKIKLQQMNDVEASQAAKYYQLISEMPFEISNKATTPLQIRRQASRMKAKKDLSLIVVDYLQLMKPDTPKSSKQAEVSDISRELKLMAMEFDVPILALSQFNRASTIGTNGNSASRKPQMSEARDSGSIEQDANTFLTLWEPQTPSDPTTLDWQAYHYCQVNGMQWLGLAVDKNRNGGCGRIDMAFAKSKMRFECLDFNGGQ